MIGSPRDATNAMSLTTGTYNQRLYYRITFKTNTNDYRVLASNLLTSNNYSVSLSAQALGLAQGEYVTDVRFEFRGRWASGFASVINPTIQVQVKGTLANGYQIVNRSDVGGQYLNEWQTALRQLGHCRVRRFQPNTPAAQDWLLRPGYGIERTFLQQHLAGSWRFSPASCTYVPINNYGIGGHASARQERSMQS